MRSLLIFARGFCMGAADIVPGVSGGTVALVFGIYERLLDNIRRSAKVIGSVLRLDFAAAKENLLSVEWGFLIPLGAGIAVALGALASVIEELLQNQPEAMAGLFFGLVGGSIVVAWGLLKQRTAVEPIVMVAVGIVTFLLLGFQSGPVANPSTIAYFGSGAIAICAMILPGISGSFLLLMLGMYAAVLGAVHDRSGSDLVHLAVFSLGALIGISLFSTALGWVLDRHHDRLLAVLIGLMIGSFRVLWPWPNGVGIISEVEGQSISGTGLDLPPSGQLLAPTILALLAFALVVAVSWLAPRQDEELAPGPLSNTGV